MTVGESMICRCFAKFHPSAVETSVKTTVQFVCQSSVAWMSISTNCFSSVKQKLFNLNTSFFSSCKIKVFQSQFQYQFQFYTAFHCDVRVHVGLWLMMTFVISCLLYFSLGLVPVRSFDRKKSARTRSIFATYHCLWFVETLSVITSE